MCMCQTLAALRQPAPKPPVAGPEAAVPRSASATSSSTPPLTAAQSTTAVARLNGELAMSLPGTHHQHRDRGAASDFGGRHFHNTDHLETDATQPPPSTPWPQNDRFDTANAGRQLRQQANYRPPRRCLGPAAFTDRHHHRSGHRLLGHLSSPAAGLWRIAAIGLIFAVTCSHIAAVEASPSQMHRKSSGHSEGAVAFDRDTTSKTPVNDDAPAFLTRSDAFKFKLGEVIELPCDVKNAANYKVAWKRGIAILTADTVKVTPDPRVQLVRGFTLQIANATQQDVGDYSCQIATMTPTEITHTVDILVPPSIYKPPVPNIMTKNGGSVRLECLASGNPAPNITWTRRNNVMPTDYRIKSGVLVVQSLDRHKAGQYVCHADNGVGDPVMAVATVQVQFPPEITVDQPTVFTGETAEAQLSCTVEGISPPEVTWFKETMQLEGTDRHHAQKHATRFTLIIRNVQASDFGNYTCSAENSMGKARKTLKLTGKPNEAVVRSGNSSHFKDKYNVSWVVYSHSPIEEYKLSFRKVPDNPAELNHIDHHGHGHGHSGSQKSYSNHGYGNGHWPSRYDWRDLVLPAVPQSHELEQSMSYMIKNLEANQLYEVEITSRNKHGWSEKIAHITFTTALNDGTFDIHSFLKQGHLSDSEMRDLSVTHYSTTSGSSGAPDARSWPKTSTWGVLGVVTALLRGLAGRVPTGRWAI